MERDGRTLRNRIWRRDKELDDRRRRELYGRRLELGIRGSLEPN